MKLKSPSILLLIIILVSFVIFIPVKSNVLENSSSLAMGPLLKLEKRVNQSEILVDEEIAVEIIITNIGNDPVYNVQLDEPALSNPAITYNNFPNSISFDVIEGEGIRKYTYTFSAATADNYTLQSSKVTYYQDPNWQETLNAPQFTSISQEVSVEVLSLDTASKSFDKELLFLFFLITIIYSLILILRTIIRFFGNNNPASDHKKSIKN